MTRVSVATATHSRDIQPQHLFLQHLSRSPQTRSQTSLQGKYSHSTMTTYCNGPPHTQLSEYTQAKLEVPVSSALLSCRKDLALFKLQSW